jgi:hypothetical protein
MIGVQYQDQIALGVAEGGVDVAGLGVLVALVRS